MCVYLINCIVKSHISKLSNKNKINKDDLDEDLDEEIDEEFDKEFDKKLDKELDDVIASIDIIKHNARKELEEQYQSGVDIIYKNIYDASKKYYFFFDDYRCSFVCDYGCLTVELSNNKHKLKIECKSIKNTIITYDDKIIPKKDISEDDQYVIDKLIDLIEYKMPITQIPY